MAGERDQAAQGEGKPLDFLLSFKGRIGRGQFLAGLGVIFALAVCMLLAAANFMDPRGGPGLFIPVTILLLLAMAWIHAAIVVKRVRDAGHPGWHYFIFGPGPFVLLLAAERLGSLWLLGVAGFLGLIAAPAFFPSKPAEG
jgi:uncharacterized membrane protein YhaH (DUF805 family)